MKYGYEKMTPDPKPYREKIPRHTVAWRARVMEVIERDLYTCRCCKQMFRPRYLCVHHIRSVGAGGGDELSNLVSLCKECHVKVHTGEKHLEFEE